VNQEIGQVVEGVGYHSPAIEMSTLIVIAVLPALLLALYFYLRDKYEREPIRMLLGTFLIGMFLVTALSAIIEPAIFYGIIKHTRTFQIRILLSSFLMAACVEEGCKFYAFKIAVYNNKNFNEPYDGIMYAVMIGLGFASGENIMYVLRAMVESGSLAALQLAKVRAMLSIPAHAANGVILGYFWGLGKFSASPRKRLYYPYLGLALAILAHGLYNYIAMNGQLIGFFGAFAIVILSGFLSALAMNSQLAISPFIPHRHFHRDQALHHLDTASGVPPESHPVDK
jgi:protease PrsW